MYCVQPPLIVIINVQILYILWKNIKLDLDTNLFAPVFALSMYVDHLAEASCPLRTHMMPRPLLLFLCPIHVALIIKTLVNKYILA